MLIPTLLARAFSWLAARRFERSFDYLTGRLYYDDQNPERYR